MIAMMWNVSAAFRRYLRTYLPTNIVIYRLRTGRGRRWAVPAAVVAALAYLFAAAMASSGLDRGGPGWLNVLILLFAWNAMKFAVGALLVFVRGVPVRSPLPPPGPTDRGDHRFGRTRKT